MLLLENGFRQYSVAQIIEKYAVLGTVEIAGGEHERVELLADEDFYYALAQNEKVTINIPDPGFVYAPVAEGQTAGFAQIYLNGQWIGKVSLVFGDNVEQIPQTEKKPWKHFLRGDNE